MSEHFEQMTVLELRKAAKELGVKLGAHLNKQDIVDKLTAAAAEKAPTDAPPVRHAAIITDDGTEDDDSAFSDPASRPAPAVRPVIPPRSTGMGGASALSTISAKAPAFTMEGSRAWHNPHVYTGAVYQRPAANTWNNRSGADSRPYGARPAVPGRVSAPAQGFAPRRFGPEPQEQAPVQDYRAPYSAPAQPDYRDYQQPAPRQPVSYARREAGENQQLTMNELLMTGDCGDATGTLEIQPEGYGFLRADSPAKKDVYVSAAQIRRFTLRSGDLITGKTRPQRENDRTVALLYITEINGQDPEEATKRTPFESLTALYPHRRIRLTARGHQDPFLRLTELLFPIGFGQRALIRVPGACDAAAVFQKLSNAIVSFNAKAQVLALLLDEKPEEVTEFKERIQAEIIAHTADQPIEALVRTAENALERAQRLVEQKTDVVLLVNDVSRLCRACGQLAPAAARTLANGLAAGCMNRPRRFFGSARNTKEAGSLTILALAQPKANDPADVAAVEELRQIANLEIVLLPSAGKNAIAPGFDLSSSRNVRPELLLTEAEARAARLLRAGTLGMDAAQTLDYLAELIESTENNEALLASMDN